MLTDVLAQSPFTPETVSAYKDILKLKTNSSAVKEVLNATPEHSSGAVLYLSSYWEVVQLLKKEDEKKYQVYRKNRAKRLKILQKSSEPISFLRFYEAGIRLQWTAVKLKYEDRLSAFWDARNAYQLLKENVEEYPEFTPTYLWLGILEVLLSEVPERYHWFLSLMGMEGDTEKGIDYLDEVIFNNQVLSEETIKYKSLLQMYVLHDSEKAFNNFLSYYKSDSTDFLSLYALTQIALKVGKTPKILPFLSKRKLSEAHGELPIFYYLEGVAYLQAGKYNESIAPLYTFLKKAGESNYVRDTHYKLFLAHWFLNNEEEAQEHLKRITQVGKNYIGVDQYATAFAKKDQLPNKQITRARYLSDGGYHYAAMDILREIRVYQLSLDDKIELFYRKGKIYQSLAEWQNAIHQYTQILGILEGNKYSDYLVPNAALQLGIIYKKHFKNDVQAKKYFEMVLKFDGDYPYKASIRDEAKALLRKE